MLAVVGGIGLWLAVVVIPTIQAEFGIDRAGASLPYTATFIGFAFGGYTMGRVADRYGVRVPISISGVALGVGFILAAVSQNYWQFVVVQAVFIGFLGSASTFGPLVADTSQWFLKRRGIAIAIVASGNYIAGTIWPPFLQYAIESYGWRSTYVALGLFCVIVMVPLAQLLSRRPQFDDTASPASRSSGQKGLLPKHPLLYPALVLAGLSCCVAMSMPQVHIVAYCADLGFGPARGAEMLSLMLGFGVLSRLASGFIADRIGGLATLIAGSFLQMLALAVLHSLRRPDLALHRLGHLRPVARRHRAELCAHHPRPFPGTRGGSPHQHGAHRHRLRHGLGRLAVGRDLRLDRFLHRRLPQRRGLERAEPRHRPVDSLCPPAPDAGGARPGVTGGRDVANAILHCTRLLTVVLLFAGRRPLPLTRTQTTRVVCHGG